MALLLLHTACALEPTSSITVHRDVSAMETAPLGAAAHIPGAVVLTEPTKHGRGLKFAGCEPRCDNVQMCRCPVFTGYGGTGWCSSPDGTGAMQGRSIPNEPAHATFAKGVPATATSAATMIMNPWTSAVPPMSVPLLRLLALSQSLGGAGFPYFRS